jgi:hypothetical protein
VDLGIESMSPCKTPSGEWFPDYNDCTLVKVERNDAFFDFKLKDGAKVWSWFYYSNNSLGVAETYKNGDERIPGCFIYQNSAGQKFLIYAFGAHQAKS